MQARQAFEDRVQWHVEHPLRVARTLPVLLAKAAHHRPEAAAEAASPDYQRQLTPPLYVYLMALLEAFLEQFFLDTYSRKHGVIYEAREDWDRDCSRFAAAHPELKDYKGKERIRLSFQNMAQVEHLFRATLDIDLMGYTAIDTVKVMWAKRHLFIHKAGRLDRKFVDAYNEHHRNDPSRCIPAEAVGSKRAYLEPEWVADSVREAKKFVSWLCEAAAR